MSEEPLYPFGFGLSYTQFEYSDLVLENESVAAGATLKASFTLKNAGERNAAEVVQYYLTDLEASALVPKHHLIGFKRLELSAGEARKMEFAINPEMMSFFNDEGKLTLEPGDFRLEIGGCSPGQRGLDLGASEPGKHYSRSNKLFRIGRPRTSYPEQSSQNVR